MPLTISRKQGEKIFIGNDIEITLVSINGNKARISILAPPDVGVWRGELFEEIQAGRKERIS